MKVGVLVVGMVIVACCVNRNSENINILESEYFL
jgi:hypothetical protein